ncbi:MAG: hypothetical protein N2323_02290 [candidate division WOR-3 bacterium]|nr:hypothetical protein [candidate division WOR-3 bacterium]MCX7836777.1 hypothetical protein [candidate division WOR-3 bacterium]MDW8113585.1 hypothetical protein [candidate division WOR-3 bacterium]
MVKDRKKETKKIRETSLIHFKRNNYLLLILGIITIIVGYIVLSSGDITIAPILLVLGYCVLIPLALLLKFK